MSPLRDNGRHWPSRPESAFTESRTSMSACCGMSVHRGCVTRKPHWTSRATSTPNSMPSQSWPMPASPGAPPHSGCCKPWILGGGCAVAAGCGQCSSTSPTAPVRSLSMAISLGWSGRTVCPEQSVRSGRRRRSGSAIAMPNTVNDLSSSSTAEFFTIRQRGGMRISNGIWMPPSTAGRPSGFPTGRCSTARARLRARSLGCCSGTGLPCPAGRAGRGADSLGSIVPRRHGPSSMRRIAVSIEQQSAA